MPYVVKEPRHPEPWRQVRAKHRSRIVLPFVYIEWLGSWAAWFLGRSVLLEVLEYCGTLSLLVGVIFYFAGAKDRLEQKHYQAWQVINTAQGKGGSGGRIDALQELDADGVALTGVDLHDAFLQNLKLPGANLARATVSSADMRGAILHDASLDQADLESTNLRGADLRNVRFTDADLTDADFNNADLRGADLAKSLLDEIDLRNADLDGVQDWKAIQSIKLANILNCKNPPPGFREWAIANGAVEIDSDDQWNQRLRAGHVAATQPTR
jgi:hypothetical protein